MPAKYVPPYSKGQKNDFRDAEAADSDAINAVLAAVGYKFRLLLRWLRHLLFRILTVIVGAYQFRFS